MRELTIIKDHGHLYTDSRAIANIIDREHKHLMRDIARYSEVIQHSPNLDPAQFFVLSSYQDLNNRQRPCYLVTKQGCEMIANKMTGDKGIIFTAMYVDLFNKMEAPQPQSIEDLIIMQAQSVKQLKQDVEKAKQELATVNHRLDNIDRLDTIGDLKQRLNKMVQRFALQEGISIRQAWHIFDSSFNTAYRTNLTLRRRNYARRENLTRITRPQFLEKEGQLEDAVRVADKLLNTESRQLSLEV